MRTSVRYHSPRSSRNPWDYSRASVRKKRVGVTRLSSFCAVMFRRQEEWNFSVVQGVPSELRPGLG